METLRTSVDASGHRIVGLGAPAAPADATYVDPVSLPKPDGAASPGTSLLAAAADHVHPSGGSAGEIVYSKKAPSANVTIPAGCSAYIARRLELSGNVKIEIGNDATLEIG